MMKLRRAAAGGLWLIMGLGLATDAEEPAGKVSLREVLEAAHRNAVDERLISFRAICSTR